MTYVFSTTQTRRYRFPTHINKLVMDRTEAAGSARHEHDFVVVPVQAVERVLLGRHRKPMTQEDIEHRTHQSALADLERDHLKKIIHRVGPQGAGDRTRAA